jgi:hypothetical protein
MAPNLDPEIVHDYTLNDMCKSFTVTFLDYKTPTWQPRTNFYSDFSLTTIINHWS